MWGLFLKTHYNTSTMLNCHMLSSYFESLYESFSKWSVRGTERAEQAEYVG